MSHRPCLSDRIKVLWATPQVAVPGRWDGSSVGGPQVTARSRAVREDWSSLVAPFSQGCLGGNEHPISGDRQTEMGQGWGI